jgi:hypothetical protein
LLGVRGRAAGACLQKRGPNELQPLKMKDQQPQKMKDAQPQKMKKKHHLNRSTTLGHLKVIGWKLNWLRCSLPCRHRCSRSSGLWCLSLGHLCCLGG